MEFGNQIEYVMSYNIQKHEATLKMAFKGIFLGGEFLSGPPIHATDITISDPTRSSTQHSYLPWDHPNQRHGRTLHASLTRT